MIIETLHIKIFGMSVEFGGNVITYALSKRKIGSKLIKGFKVRNLKKNSRFVSDRLSLRGILQRLLGQRS